MPLSSSTLLAGSFSSAPATLTDGTPTGAFPAPIPYLKAVQGSGYFLKERKSQTNAPLVAVGLKFTSCDVLDYGLRPFGNLFSSLGLPITAADRSYQQAIYQGTALDGLQNLEQVVVAEIPATTYGEMIDGKSLSLRLPIQAADGSVSEYNLFTSYYGFNSDLNNQYSDTNRVSGFMGVEPTPENEFNSNIAYLFSNEIQRPKDTVSFTRLTSGVADIPSRDPFTMAFDMQAGATYRSLAYASGLLRVQMRVPGLGVFNLVDVVENGQVSADGYFRLRQSVSEIIYTNDSYSTVSVELGLSRVDVTSSRNWDAWSPINRFPTKANGLGKVVATLRDPNGQGAVDKPVGVVYLDKGLIVLTHPLLVKGLSRVGAMVADPATPHALIPAPAAPAPFTRLHYPADDGTLAKVSFRSVVTELSQTFTCMAQIGEFSATTNPTYALAYPEGSTAEPVYITEVGLYNRFGELMALAKTSEPVLKLPNRPSMFTLTLRV